MPFRFYIIINALEILFLNIFNAILIITFTRSVSCIAAILSVIYSIGRIKRDVDSYYNGNYKDYFLYLMGKLKK
jgi:hypothetical protein